MFSGFDQFTEGFKRFSLDALQQQEEEEASKSGSGRNAQNEVGASALAPVPEQPSEASPATQPSADKDSGLRFSAQKVHVDSQARKGIPEHENEANPEPNPMSGQRSFSDAMAGGNNALRGESPPAALEAVEGEKCDGAGSATEGDRAHGEGGAGQEAVERVVEEVVHCREEVPEQGAAIAIGTRSRLGARPTCGDSPAAAGGVKEMVSDKTVRAFWPPDHGDECGVTTSSVLSVDGEAGNTSSASATLSPGRGQRPERSETSAAKNGALTPHPGELLVAETSYTNGVGAAEATNADDRSASRHEAQHSERLEEDTASGFERLDVPAREPSGRKGTGGRSPGGKALHEQETAAGAKALMAAREEELSRAKRTASELESALGETRSEAQQLREMLATEKSTTRQQTAQLASLSDEVRSARMGFQESNAAHQRTAERSHVFEQELYKTRQTVDSLRTEAAVLREQASVGKEDRQALEAQLRQLQVGLTEGQEAARREGKKEVERLEARVKDLLKDRERKHAELELQNARRKETREMARDLESQLASVDRTANEREAELNVLKGEIAALRKNTGEAKDEKNTWATKYDALERNFKQVRAQSKRADFESEELRQRVSRIEAEKAKLEESVEVEGAERVTVVASITHERDFLLRQVNRLELSLSDLQRSQEAQAATAASRAQTTGVLEEYRTRAQQALKRANEITSQTASENKRLEAEMAKLSAEVSQQRPIWEKSKQLEDLHRGEVAELKEQLLNERTTRDGLMTKAASLQEQLEEAEEGRRNTHVSVMRLEAQGKSLKQELQRQQRALATAEEREATLQKRLADRDAVKDEGQVGKHTYEGADGTSDMVSIPESPSAAALPPSMGWEEEKLTPRSAMGAEAGGAGIAHMRHSLGGSFNSMPSDGDSVDAQPGSVGEQLFYVHQLRARMSKEQVEMRSLISELEASRTAAEAQTAKQAQLESQLEAALLDKKRLQDLDSGRNAAINLEYLKNCVVGCLRTSEPSEHARLLPVITTILKLSREEADIIAKNISSRAQHQGSFGGSLPPPAAGGRGSGSGSAAGARSWWGGVPPQNKK